MDIKEYIDSGILKRYLNGELSVEENREVEDTAELYPEVKSALEKLKMELRLDKTDEEQGKSKTKNSLIENPLKFWKTIAIIASVLLVLLSGYYYYMFNDIFQRYAMEQRRNQEIIEQLSLSQKAIIQQKSQLDKIQNIYADKHVLFNKENKSGNAILYRNKESKEIWLYVKHLGEPPQDEQYQLWLKSRNKIINLGVIGGNMDVLKKMEYTDLDGKFMLTQEPLGGSNQPSLNMLIAASEE